MFSFFCIKRSMSTVAKHEASRICMYAGVPRVRLEEKTQPTVTLIKFLTKLRKGPV